ncbi:THS1 [Candida pseudojiufengensis]|uniref:THS1 n=1 Tax=Candida pseudojiufengensis TaxID=497109 RepID=UPI00222484EE|nr:THS1 [Candida pseudojiufengensis]KAI5962313.1 THS1 [Candida pseudojiufengensis]
MGKRSGILKIIQSVHKRRALSKDTNNTDDVQTTIIKIEKNKRIPRDLVQPFFDDTGKRKLDNEMFNGLLYDKSGFIYQEEYIVPDPRSDYLKFSAFKFMDLTTYLYKDNIKPLKKTGDVQVETGDVQVETGDVQVGAGDVQVETGDVQEEKLTSSTKQGISNNMTLLTANGFVKIKDINFNETKIAVYNKDTKSFDYKFVKAVQRHSGEANTIRNYNGVILGSKQKTILRTKENSKYSDWYVGVPSQQEFNQFQLLHYLQAGYKNQNRETINLIRGFMGIDTIEKFHYFMIVLGFWIGDGSLKIDQTSNCESVWFSQIKEDDILLLEYCFKKLNLQMNTEWRKSYRIKKHEAKYKSQVFYAETVVYEMHITKVSWRVMFVKWFGCKYKNSQNNDGLEYFTSAKPTKFLEWFNELTRLEIILLTYGYNAADGVAAKFNQIYTVSTEMKQFYSRILIHGGFATKATLRPQIKQYSIFAAAGICRGLPKIYEKEYNELSEEQKKPYKEVVPNGNDIWVLSFSDSSNPAAVQGLKYCKVETSKKMTTTDEMVILDVDGFAVVRWEDDQGNTGYPVLVKGVDL